jgi:hypothetical protein
VPSIGLWPRSFEVVVCNVVETRQALSAAQIWREFRRPKFLPAQSLLHFCDRHLNAGNIPPRLRLRPVAGFVRGETDGTAAGRASALE